MSNQTVISFSGGRTSAFMTIELLRMPEYRNAMVIFTNTGKENEQTLRFVKQVNEFIGGGIVWLEYNPDPAVWFDIVSHNTASRFGQPFEALIHKRNYLPNPVARFCTQDLKIRPMKNYCQRVLGWGHWVNMVGIRYDEPNRWSKSKSVEQNEVFEVEHPLVQWKITKLDILEFWRKMPFDLELRDYEGNCDVCFLKGLNKKRAIARNTPAKLLWWSAMERAVGSTFRGEYSYGDILSSLLNAPELPFDDTIQCFCNID